MNEIEKLKKQHLLWQGFTGETTTARLKSGFSEIDHKLNGGWPASGIIQVHASYGIGELRLFVPFLEQKQKLGKLIFINPPGKLNAPFLLNHGLDLSNVLIITPESDEHGSWAVEQCLKSDVCAVVLYWGNTLNAKQTRRCALASHDTQTSMLYFQSPNLDNSTSSAAIKMLLTPTTNGINLEIIKQKGGSPVSKFAVNMSQLWPELFEDNSNQRLLTEAVTQKRQIH